MSAGLLDLVAAAQGALGYAGHVVSTYTSPEVAVRSLSSRAKSLDACRMARERVSAAIGSAAALAANTDGLARTGFVAALIHLETARHELDCVVEQVEKRRFRRGERRAKVCSAVCRTAWALQCASDEGDAAIECWHEQQTATRRSWSSQVRAGVSA